jgi:glycosyltransferase involved in cell wall biosynthesis
VSQAAALVSVIVPTRDRWPALQRALRSALGQEDAEVEVVVVDDASADGTPRELSALRDPRVIALSNSSRQGPSYSRNRGLEAARGQWVAFLDDDDLWAPYKLRTQLAVAARTGADWVYGTAVMVDAAGWPVKALPVPGPEHIARRLLDNNPIGGPSAVLARTDLVRRVGGFDERIAVVEDWDLWLRLAAAGRAAACHDVVAAYAMHGDNLSMTETERARESLRLMREKHHEASKEAGVVLGELWLSRYTALAARREGRRIYAARTLLAGALRTGRPGNVARAVGVLLGESFMRAGQRASAGRPAAPAWLDKARG